MANIIHMVGTGTIGEPPIASSPISAKSWNR